MKGMTVCAALVLLAFVVPPAVAAKEDFSGAITFRDGTVTNYTWLSFRHDEIPFTRDPADMRHYESVVRLQLRAIARIDFDNSAAARKQIARALPNYQIDSVRRATVTFGDGVVYRSVYLYCEGEWGNERERGRLSIPSIVSVTVRTTSVAACPVCSARFPEPGYGFCPFDGAKLGQSTATAAVAPTAAGPRGRVEGSGVANTKQWGPATGARQGQGDGPALQTGLGRSAGAISRVVAWGVLRALPLRSDWTQGGVGASPGPDRSGRPNRALD